MLLAKEFGKSDKGQAIIVSDGKTCFNRRLKWYRSPY